MRVTQWVQQECSNVISTFEGRDNEQTYWMFEQFVQNLSLTTNSDWEWAIKITGWLPDMQLGICGTSLLALVWYSWLCELSRQYDLWAFLPGLVGSLCLWILHLGTFSASSMGRYRYLGRYVSILDLCLGVSNAWVHHISDLWVGMSAWNSGWVCQTSGCTCSGSVVGYLISGSMCRMPGCIRSLSGELILTFHFSSMVELWLGS